MDRVDALRSDVERGPAALGDLLAVYGSEAGPLGALDPASLRGRRMAFVGLGSSWFASMDAAFALRGAGVAAWAEVASAVGAPPSKDLVAVAVSASGRTREVVEVARRHRGRSLVIGVTNAPDSPLAAASDVVLPLAAGVETAGISTLTYRATVVVLAMLAERLGFGAESGSRIEPRPTDGVIAAAADLLDGAATIDVIGPASRLGAVSQAALLLREAPRLPAHAYETSDWLHTAVYLALPRHRAVLLTGSPADAEVIDTIRRRGGEVVTIGPAVVGGSLALEMAQGSPVQRTVSESAVIDRLALELWDRVRSTEVPPAIPG